MPGTHYIIDPRVRRIQIEPPPNRGPTLGGGPQRNRTYVRIHAMRTYGRNTYVRTYVQVRIYDISQTAPTSTKPCLFLISRELAQADLSNATSFTSHQQTTSHLRGLMPKKTGRTGELVQAALSNATCFTSHQQTTTRLRGRPRRS